MILGILLLGRFTIETVGGGLVSLTPTKSFATQFGTATAIMISSLLGWPVSTSHCIIGSIIGTNLMNGEAVDFNTLKKIVWGWVVTIPASMVITFVVYQTIQILF